MRHPTLCFLALLGWSMACSGSKEPDGDEDEDEQGEEDGDSPIVDADGDGYLADGSADHDCDDDDPEIHPGAEDAWYDGVDSDCAGNNDLDADGDGAEWEGVGGDDCDDEAPGVHPGASEHCDERDEDCDGQVDEEATNARTWHRDADEDGYGDSSDSIRDCEPPEGHVADSMDCDDANPEVHPSAIEISCDGLDNNCDSDFGIAGAWWEGTYYPTVQAALDASASAGGLVEVCEGRHVESLLIEVDGPLTLSGSLGPEHTTIEGRGDGPAVRIDEGEVLLRGLRITGGTGDGSSDLHGGGVYIQTSEPTRLEDCVIEENTADRGAGLYLVRRGVLSLERVTIRNNVAYWGGGGMEISPDATVSLTAVSISDNTTEYGGAGAEIDSATVVTADASTTIEGNIAYTPGASGGGLSLSGGVIWTGGRVVGNIAGDAAGAGGGISASCSTSADPVILEDIEISNNQGDFGGGIHGNCVMTLTRVEISDNESFWGGGGIWIEQPITIVDSRIIDNSGGEEGGGLRLADTWVEVTNSDFGTGTSDNEPDDVAVGDVGESVSSYTFGSSSTFRCQIYDGCE